MSRFRLVVLTFALILPCVPCPQDVALAQWSADPMVNTPVCVTAARQGGFGMVDDGNGGAIIVWQDLDLNTSENDLYAQRINSDGIIQWGAGGVTICDVPGHQTVPSVARDGAGGAFVVWQDNRSGQPDIYAQRIDSNGVVQWLGNGVPVCDTILDQTSAQVTGDGEGGAIVTWRDRRAGSNYVPYAQRLNGSGAGQWVNQGVLLSLNGIAEALQLVSDGRGGAIITWHQYISPPGQFDIYVQRILATGTPAWGPQGVPLCGLASNQLRPRIVTNGDDGAVVVWEDFRDGSFPNLRAQAVDSNGAPLWTTDGVDVAPLSTLGQWDPRQLSDGAGGVFITWQYDNFGIYVQRLNSSGAPQWALDGVSLDGAWDSRAPEIETDGSAGALITWYRGLGNSDIYAQRINAAGAVQWTANGVAVSLASSGQIAPKLVSDGNGNSILAWLDSRDALTTEVDLYAQWVSSSGTLGVPTGVENEPHVRPGSFRLDQNVPNPFNPSTTISYLLPTRSRVTLEVYNVLGRRVVTLVQGVQGPGVQRVTVDARTWASGVYYYRIESHALDRGESLNFVDTRKFVLIR